MTCEWCNKRAEKYKIVDMELGFETDSYTYYLCVQCTKLKMGLSNPTLHIYDLQGKFLGTNKIVDKDRNVTRQKKKD